MKETRRSLCSPFSLILLLAVIFTVLAGPSAVQAKTVKAVEAGSVYKVGSIVYYVHPQYGYICAYNTKTKKNTRLRGNEGTDWGYTRLIVKGKYIYALLDKSVGSDGGTMDAEIDRISLNGKSRKTLANHTWFSFSMAGSKIYYSQMTGGSNYDGREGAAMCMKLNGKGKASAAGITLAKHASSALTISAYGTSSGSTGKYSYSIAEKGKILKRGSRTLFKCKGTDWIPYIQSVDAHGDAVLAKYSYRKSNGMVYCRLIYMDRNGKNRKVLSDYMPVS